MNVNRTHTRAGLNDRAAWGNGGATETGREQQPQRKKFILGMTFNVISQRRGKLLPISPSPPPPLPFVVVAAVAFVGVVLVFFFCCHFIKYLFHVRIVINIKCVQTFVQLKLFAVKCEN